MAYQTNLSTDEVISAAKSLKDERIYISFIILCPKNELEDGMGQNLEQLVMSMNVDVHFSKKEESSCITFLSPTSEDFRNPISRPIGNSAQDPSRVCVHFYEY